MNELLIQLEHEARQRALTLRDTGKLHWTFIAEHYPPNPAYEREARHLNTALKLADNADTFVALIKEGRAPRQWMRARLRELGVRR